MSRSLRLGGAIAALALAAGVGMVSVERTRDQLAVLEACEALEVGDVATTLALTAGRVGTDDTGRAAAECRCGALLANGDHIACRTLLEEALGDPAQSDWSPGPDLARLLIQAWREDGRAEEAASLARRAGRAHPTDAHLFHVELEARAGVEDETQVLRELALRLPARGETAAAMRVSLAQHRLRRGETTEALEVLGPVPPDGIGKSLGLWYDTRGLAHALDDDLPNTQRTYEAWRIAGGDPTELRARYALALSLAGLGEATRTPVMMLREALDDADQLDDAALHEALVIRLVLTLVNDGQLDGALALYDREHTRFALEGLTRAELLRASEHRRLAGATPDERRGTLRFVVDDAPPGHTLWVTPQPDAPLDAPYERHPLPASGVLHLDRAVGLAPQRWVLRDADDRVIASGTVAPRAGETRTVRIVARAAARAAEPSALSRLAGDGHRRVGLVLLDCGDWRIVQYLRARGELPTLDALLEVGYRAVLDSDPPLTAAALEALVWPSRRGDASTVGTVHRLGIELSGLASIGENPFDFLSWVLPESRDLFSVIGSGERSAANLLLAHGGIRAGRHGEVTGPDGLHERLPMGRSARDLDAAERDRWPQLAALARTAGSERDALHVRTIAAELDAATEILRAREVDLLALRVEALDLLTHAHFAQTVGDGQDDGRGLLFSVYRYLDARLFEVNAALDADDVLIVMSDHGIRTSMEHSRHAIFAAVGAGVPRGRAPGRPALRGVSRVVAELLDVATDWPDTGVAGWSGELPALAAERGAATAGGS